MNRKEFIDQLERNLAKISQPEKIEIIRDYEEYFSIGLENGKTEDEVSVGLGSPVQIAKEIVSLSCIENLEKRQSIGNIFRAIMAGIGMSLFNIFIMLVPFIVVVALLVTGWSLAVAAILNVPLYFVSYIFFSSGFEWFELYLLIGFTGIGLLIFVAMLYLTKWVWKGFIKYLKANIKVVKGEPVYEKH